jgi:hypothetical protein
LPVAHTRGLGVTSCGDLRAAFAESLAGLTASLLDRRGNPGGLLLGRGVGLLPGGVGALADGGLRGVLAHLGAVAAMLAADGGVIGTDGTRDGRALSVGSLVQSRGRLAGDGDGVVSQADDPGPIACPSPTSSGCVASAVTSPPAKIARGDRRRRASTLDTTAGTQ